jgi:uncharacterized protein (DUF1330 family)
MKTNCKMAVALVVGAAAGGAAIQGLHAQARPPVYLVQEITVSNLQVYTQDYVTKARELTKASGGRSIVIGSGKVTSIEGEPEKARVVIQQWESMEKLQAYLDSPENKALRAIGDKSAKFRVFAVEGAPQ